MKILAKINSKELLKWLLFSSLILAFFEGLGEVVPQEDSAYTFSYSINHNDIGSNKIYDSNLSSFHKFFEDFEKEETEDEEDDYEQGFAGSTCFQTLSIPLALNELTQISSFPPRKKIKLFILFHSWKSFLQS